MTRVLRHMLLLMAVLWSVVLLPEHALAQTASLGCSSGSASGGELFDHQEACKFTGGVEHIFSTVICNFVQMLNSVLSSVYCGFQELLKNMVGAALTLYIAIFGVQMLMGVASTTAREFLVRIAKITLVWTFVSNASWGIQYAFQFFILLASQGVEWVMSSIPTPFDSGDCYDAAAASATGFMAALTRLDVVICKAVTGPLGSLDSKLVGFFLVLSLLAPQIGMLILSWLWLNLKVLVEGLVTFLLGITAIAFLIAMSPIFLSLMLFKATAGFFENWLKYMTSFSLQIILVFAVGALWLTVTVHFLAFFNNLNDTIFADEKLTSLSQEQDVTSSWGVCPFDYSADGAGAPPDAPPGPYVKCTNPNFNTANKSDKEKVIPTSALLFNDKEKALGCKTGEATDDCTKYLQYVIYHLISLIIIAFAFESLLREAPRIAVYLSGPDYTPPLAGGFAVSRGGQIRSLFSSSGGRDDSGSGGERKGLFSSLRDGLFGANDTPPPPRNLPRPAPPS